MPFCEFWRAEHAGLSLFAVLEVSHLSYALQVSIELGRPGSWHGREHAWRALKEMGPGGLEIVGKARLPQIVFERMCFFYWV